MNRKVRQLISYGSHLLGSTIKYSLHEYLGPSGIIIGNVIGDGIEKVLNDIANRVLSKREEERVGASSILILKKINERLKSGYKPRNDDFFSKKVNNRSSADEIFEGVLLKCKNEHEEKKIYFISNIFTNVAFSKEISVGEANHLIQEAQNLTYRKMCILSMLKDKDENESTDKQIKLRDNHYMGLKSEIDFETISILQEMFELYSNGLIYCEKYDSLSNYSHIWPSQMYLTKLGNRYHEIMGLKDILQADKITIINLLKDY